MVARVEMVSVWFLAVPPVRVLSNVVEIHRRGIRENLHNLYLHLRVDISSEAAISCDGIPSIKTRKLFKPVRYVPGAPRAPGRDEDDTRGVVSVGSG